MAVWGATGKVIGNNPLAIGVPHKETEDPMVLDMAMNQAAVGKVGTWLREGREIPPNWGLDEDGKPSSNAHAILQRHLTEGVHAHQPHSLKKLQKIQDTFGNSGKQTFQAISLYR
jgi:LDH2 family malate/lactate/ureidoglycolate dehydrogenase